MTEAVKNGDGTLLSLVSYFSIIVPVDVVAVVAAATTVLYNILSHVTAKMRCFLLAFCFASLAWALPAANPSTATRSNTWSAQQFSHLITFGDSYTDENRLNYFYGNNDNPPPPGTVLPEACSSPRQASGGPR